jgi:threonine/homoserine/homoserine lactone efflux protein
MVKLLIEGFVLGTTLAFLIGPAFFALIQTSINRGFKAGVQLAIGISLSDAVVLVLIYFGVIQFIDAPGTQLYFGIIGGGILIGFGIYTFVKKEIVNTSHEVKIDNRFSRALTFITKGFFLNFMNPFVWFFWITVSVTKKSSLQTPENIFLFFVITLLTLVSTDIVKCFFANKIKRLLSARVMFLINKIVGILLFGFGIVLIVRVLLANFNKL